MLITMILFLTLENCQGDAYWYGRLQKLAAMEAEMMNNMEELEENEPAGMKTMKTNRN